MCIFFARGCGIEQVSDKDLKQDIVASDKAFQINSDMEITKMEVLADNIDNKARTECIKCAIQASNDSIDYSSEYKAVYRRYEQGWKLEQMDIAENKWELKRADVEANAKEVENELKRNNIPYTSYQIHEPQIDLDNNLVSYDITYQIDEGKLQEMRGTATMNYVFLSPQEGWRLEDFQFNGDLSLKWKNDALKGTWKLHCGELFEENCYSTLTVQEVNNESNGIKFEFQHYRVDENGNKTDVEIMEGVCSRPNNYEFIGQLQSGPLYIHMDANDIWSGQLAFEKE